MLELHPWHALPPLLHPPPWNFQRAWNVPRLSSQQVPVGSSVHPFTSHWVTPTSTIPPQSSVVTQLTTSSSTCVSTTDTSTPKFSTHLQGRETIRFTGANRR